MSEYPIPRQMLYVPISAPLGRRSDMHPLRGREELLATIGRAFKTKDVRNVHVLHGLGGSGKTAIALEMASRASDAGVEVWWISGNDPVAFVAGMRSLASSIGVTEAELAHSDPADSLWRHLKGLAKPWLLIIDNVDDPAILNGTAGYLADGTGWIRPNVGAIGRVLVTSRFAGASTWGSWCDLHHVKMLNDDDGAQVLLDYVSSTSADVKSARSLSAQLGGLPLAVRLAGLYLANTGSSPWPEPDAITSLKDYLDALQRGSMPDNAARDTLSQAWDLSLDLLERRGSNFARPLLYLVSLFADAAFPFATLLEPNRLNAAPGFAGIDGTLLWKTLKSLADFGLVELVEPGPGGPAETSPYLRLHPLVRHIIRGAAPAGAEAAEYLEIAASLVARACDSTNSNDGHPAEPKHWLAWSSLAPHVSELASASVSNNVTDRTVQDMVDAICSLASSTLAKGIHDDAETLLRLSVQMTEARLGILSLDALHARSDLAHVLAARSKYDEADLQYSLALERSKVLHGDSKTGGLGLRHNYAHFQIYRGDSSAAVRLFTELLSLEEREYGVEDPRTLTTAHCLADALLAWGKYEEALASYEAVHATRSRVLGRQHADTLETLHQYAHALGRVGRLDEAELSHRELIVEQTSIFGPGHRATLNTRHCLSHLLSGRGQLVEATIEVRAALAGRRLLYGDVHPSTLDLRRCLAVLLASQQQAELAKQEVLTVVDLFATTLGRHHSDTLKTRHDLAHVLADANDLVGAQMELSAVYALQLRTLGAKHPETKSTKVCLDAQRRRASQFPGAFPVHGAGRPTSTGKKKRRKR